ATVAPESANRYPYSSALRKVESVTGTAPMRRAPRKLATNVGESASRSTTRSPGSTHAARSPLPARAASAAVPAYVIVVPSWRNAGRSPRPAARCPSSSAAARLKGASSVSTVARAGLEVLPAEEAVRDREPDGGDLRL